MMNVPGSAERLMAYSEVGKVINEARAGMFAIVQGIHNENTMFVRMDSHIFEFEITGIKPITENALTCQRCKRFSVPYPIDRVCEALMAAHLTVCTGG